MTLKKKIISTCETGLRKTNMSDVSICMLLRITHFLLPFFFAAVMVFGSHTAFLITSLVCLFICFMFYYFDGCIYTMVEYRFSKDDWTAFDPALEISGFEANKENRKAISIYNFVLNIIMVLLLYYYRFGPKKLNIE